MNTNNQSLAVNAGQEFAPARQMSRARFAVAFGVAAISDFLSVWVQFAVPLQWLLDLGTAGLLFLILGRKWALLPGLVGEAIPGVAAFPVWILVVLSIIVHDEIEVPAR
ncbi:MAG TPA: hypothetical protein VFZ27_13425 [Terriglobia bacterium]|nr:hypothetical protein [Terriglobia bacterium]